MFCDRTANQKISKLHERALRIAYDDYCSSFEELLNKDGAVTIHQRNLRALAVEMYKIPNGLSPTFMFKIINELGILHRLVRLRLILMEISHGKCFDAILIIDSIKSF